MRDTIASQLVGDTAPVAGPDVVWRWSVKE